MRRAIIATAGTVVGLVLLLDYRASGPLGTSRVPVGAGPALPTSAAPTTSATGPPTTSGTAATLPTTPVTSPARGGHRYTGDDVQYQYGDIAVQLTVSGRRISAIQIPQESATDPRSQSINSQAIPILTQEALAAQSLRFDVVSGATFTSDAFAQSMQSALNRAGG